MADPDQPTNPQRPSRPPAADVADDPNASLLAQTAREAVAAFQRGDWADADSRCRQILSVQPDNYDALTTLGIVAVHTRRALEAAEVFSRAAALCPERPEAHSNLGNVLHDLKRSDEALASYDRALAIAPRYARALNNRGAVLRDLQRYEEALASHDRALEIEPNYAEALNNRGLALRALKRYEEALESHDRALGIKPNYAEAMNDRGVALMDLGRPQDAAASYDRALAIKPDYAEALSNRGVALCALGRPDDALSSFDRALAIRPDAAVALVNRGNALADLKRNAEAIACYERAIAMKPDFASAHWNLSLCSLRLGDFATGWREYEWRWEEEPWRGTKPKFAQPEWLGAEALTGKTLLLYNEQGLGDTLQFCRYTKRAAESGANVVLVVHPQLLPLLAGLEGTTHVLERRSELPLFDCCCPLPSAPLAFNTHLDTIPAEIPYIRSDPARVGAWRERLGAKTRPRVGVVWSGNPEHLNDRNRSIELEQMLALVGERVEWVSLQKDVRAADGSVLASRDDIRHFGKDLRDFADTAALVEHMDLVVTVDTSVAHLAGAMGKPTWILLPFNPDWRWLLDREDSPWYPTARLFRQPAIGDWASVLARVRAELGRHFGAH